MAGLEMRGDSTRQMEEMTTENGPIREEQWRAWAHLARRGAEERERRRNRRAGIAAAMMMAGLISCYLANR